MELKRYKQQIRDHLIGDITKNSHRNALIAKGVRGGALKHTDDLEQNYEDLVRCMSKFKGAVLTQMHSQYPDSSYVPKGGCLEEMDDCCMQAPKKVSRGIKKIVQPVDQGGDMSSEDETEFKGGKFNFVKSMKHIGHDIGEGTKKVAIGLVAKEAGTQLVKGLSSGAKAIGNAASSAASSLVASAPEDAVVAEEAAPLLMACGMKKPKRTRKLSQKEVNRHALIRKLMSQHKCSLAEASRHIKENNIQY
jgi:hypothetical protein